MGLEPMRTEVDLTSLKDRVEGIVGRLNEQWLGLLASQNVRMMTGYRPPRRARRGCSSRPPVGWSRSCEADAVLVSTGSRPRIPPWCEPDGERILTTRDCYPPPVLPEHLVVVGSGVTGVEFVHMFTHARVQGHADREPPAGAARARTLRSPRRWRPTSSTGASRLLKGARAAGVERFDDGVVVQCDDGRAVEGSHVLLAIGSIPNSDGLGLEPPASRSTAAATSRSTTTASRTSATSTPRATCRGSCRCRRWPPCRAARSPSTSWACTPVSTATSTTTRPRQAIFTEPEIAEVGLVEAEAFALGRKIRVTKVPYSAAAKALINSDTRGFIKILSDPATGVVLGGVIVGSPRRRADLRAGAGRHRQPQGQRHRREPPGAPVAVAKPWPKPPSSERDIARLGRPRRAPSRPSLRFGAGALRFATSRAERHARDGSAAYSMTTTTSPAPTVSPAETLTACDRAGLLGVDLVLHLHGLEHHDGLADLDGLHPPRPAPSRSCPASAR